MRGDPIAPAIQQIFASLILETTGEVRSEAVRLFFAQHSFRALVSHNPASEKERSALRRALQSVLRDGPEDWKAAAKERLSELAGK
jgi:hypothetical protein